MDWYYLENDQQVGPVNDEEMKTLLESGKIDGNTMVKNDPAGEWVLYSQVKSAVEKVLASSEKCSECGNTFSTDDMIQHQGLWICAGCKPVFLQRIREGANLPGTLNYGGFWIRFGAKVIDWLVLWPVNFAVTFLFSMSAPLYEQPDSSFLVMQVFASLIPMVVTALYTTLMVGRWGATLGKMACGLMVVMPDGGKVSYGRAACRYLSEILSGMVFCLGYIVAAWDDEKRTLHDRICNTRVIRK